MNTRVAIAISLIFTAYATCFAQYKTQSIGGVSLTLGTSREAVIKSLTPKFTLSPAGKENYIVMQFNPKKNEYKSFGVVAFDNGILSYLNKEMDLEAWADDKQYSMGMAVYDAINGSVSAADSDGAKRAAASIVVSNQEATEPEHLNIRTIDIYIGNKKTSITTSDGPSGKSTSVSVTIKAKQW